MKENLIGKGYVALIVVVCQIAGLLLGLQICLELPPDWLLFETKIPVRVIIPIFSMFIGIAVAGIIVNLLGVKLTEQEREKAREEREKGLQIGGLGFILIGTLALLASVGASEYEKAEIQVVGILILIVGSLIAMNILYLIFSGVSIVLVYAGYPQIPAIILVIPFLLLAWLSSTGKKKSREDTGEQKHYDERGIYKGYSRRHGDRIEHYDEYGIYIGYSVQQGNRMIRYDKEGRYVGEREEKRPPGRA